jgi:uncharacterized protein with FMN-binding domain
MRGPVLLFGQPRFFILFFYYGGGGFLLLIAGSCSKLKRRTGQTHIIGMEDGGRCLMKYKHFPAILKPATLFLMVSFFWNCAGFKAAPGASRYFPGTYEGAGQGFRGLVHLMVWVDDTGITGIKVLEHEEDEQIGGAAMEELLALVLDTGSPDVDGISGATESSTGFLAALEDALSRARAP